jgi:hypothetical protein
MQCANPLKQFGLAVHTFTDARGGIPPITIGQDNATIWVSLWPYHEQISLYDLYIRKTGNFRQGMSAALWDGTNIWGAGSDGAPGSEALSDQDKHAFASVAIIKCPTRRGAARVETASGMGNSDAPGPLGDYAAVIVLRARDYDPASNYPHANGSNRDWRHYFQFGEWLTFDQAAIDGTGRNGPLETMIGPFRVAARTPFNNNWTHWRAIQSWAPRDEMSWWQDGTSNQIIIGEKHIPLARIGTCTSDPFGYIDCSYLLVSNRNQATAGRPASTRLSQGVIARNPTVGDTSGSPENDFSFGSWHPGVCQFLFGDGAVRSLNTSILPLLFCNLSDVQDGMSVALP